jgi:hypothetical protein
MRPYAVGFILCITNILAANCCIPTWSKLSRPQDFPLLFISVSLSYSTPANRGTQPPQPGGSGSISSRLAGPTSNTSVIGTQQECRHQAVHHNVAKAATRNVTQNVHLKIVSKTESSENEKPHAAGCNYTHIVVNSRQWIILRTAGVLEEPLDHFITARNGKPTWST